MNFTELNVSPKYDVGNSFGNFYNEDFNEKTGPLYDYNPAGKLEYGTTSSKNKAAVERDRYYIQKSNVSTGYVGEQEATKGTAAIHRIRPGIEQKTFTIGNDETEVTNNKDIWRNNKQEKFTNDPSSNSSFTTSALQSEERYMKNEPIDKNIGEKIKNDFAKIGKEFGNTALYAITFGKVDRRDKETFMDDSPKALRIFVIIIIIILCVMLGACVINFIFGTSIYFLNKYRLSKIDKNENVDGFETLTNIDEFYSITYDSKENLSYLEHIKQVFNAKMICEKIGDKTNNLINNIKNKIATKKKEKDNNNNTAMRGGDKYYEIF